MNDIVGYRFHPTDLEIVDHYLRLKLLGNVDRVRAINEVDVFKHNPWDLCRLSAIKSDSMWHFFCCKNFKYASGERVNRTTDSGYWKKTGNDRKIKKGIIKQVIGVKKNLVFYIGRSPNGEKTNWIMHEYHPTFVPPGERTFVLCRMEKKEGEENDGTPGVEREPSSHAPSGSRDHVGDNTVSAPEVIGKNSLQTLVTKNGGRVVDDTVFSPEVIRNASQQTLLTGNGNCCVENEVSSPEGNDSIGMCLKFLTTTPLEQLGIILSPASEFQVQETVAANNIQAENGFANNLEGAPFKSCVTIEGDDDIDLFLRGDEYVNHGQINAIFSKGNGYALSDYGHAQHSLGLIGQDSLDSGPRFAQNLGSISGGYQRTEPFISRRDGSPSIDQCVSAYERPRAPLPPCLTSLTVNSRGCRESLDEILEINALTICESSDGSQDSPKSLSDAAASPAKGKSVPRELESSRDSDINVFPVVENSNDSQHSAISSFSVAASQAAKGSAHMQQKSYAISHIVAAASSPATKKGDKMRGKSKSSPATKKSANMEDSSRSLFVAAASPAPKKRESMVQKSSRGINVLPMVKSADKKSVHMQQKSSPKSTSKDAKKGSTTASPARKSVYTQRKSSSKTWSDDTTEESSSSSDDSMTYLLHWGTKGLQNLSLC